MAGHGRARSQGRRGGQGQEGDQPGGRPQTLGVSTAPKPGPARRPQRGLGAHGGGSLHPGQTGGCGRGAGRPGQPRKTHPPGRVRADGTAAPPRGGAGVCGRRFPGGFYPGRGPPARQPSIRRTLGAPLAGCRAFWGERRIRVRRVPPGRIPLPGLGDSGPQRRPALRRVCPATTRRRFDQQNRAAGRGRGHRVPGRRALSWADNRQDGGKNPLRSARRHDFGGGRRVSGPDPGLCALPRPQV